MVEVAGIEPASLGYIIKASTYVVCFLISPRPASTNKIKAQLAFYDFAQPTKAIGRTSLHPAFYQPTGKIDKKA